MRTLFTSARIAARSLAKMTDSKRSEVLRRVAKSIVENEGDLLLANRLDLSRMDKMNPLYDRLQLTHQRLLDIAADMEHVADLPNPLGKITSQRTLENGIKLHRVSVPFGVIGVIYEARPNVTFDVFSLCLKSGNACVLKGGKDAEESNKCAVSIIQKVLKESRVDKGAIVLMPSTHESTQQMLNAVGEIDLCIPRGGRRLIDFVRDNARIPVIETGAGVVHAYFDKDGDLEKGKAILANAKMRRVSVCNALDCLLVHKDREKDLKELLSPMEGKVTMHMNEDFGREWMSYDLSIRIVDSVEDAIEHIHQYSSGHSECIITENAKTAKMFQQEVDAACVYWNVPTSFTDGAQFGLGAEIGISTQKLGPRGPMALDEITTYKWIIEGDGQVRP